MATSPAKLVLRGGSVLHSLTRHQAVPGSLDQDWFLVGEPAAAAVSLVEFVEHVARMGTILCMAASPVMLTILLSVVDGGGRYSVQKVQIALDAARSVAAVVMPHDMGASQCVYDGITFFGTEPFLLYRDTGEWMGGGRGGCCLSLHAIDRTSARASEVDNVNASPRSTKGPWR